jgi:hypothetical protein
LELFFAFSVASVSCGTNNTAIDQKQINVCNPYTIYNKANQTEKMNHDIPTLKKISGDAARLLTIGADGRTAED